MSFLSRNVKEYLQRFLDPNPHDDDFQHLINSSLSINTSTSAVNLREDPICSFYVKLLTDTDTANSLNIILYLSYTAGGAVTSLGWVTPGAATEGITPLFLSWKTRRPFLVASYAVSSLVSSSQNLTTFFAHRCHYHYRFLLLSPGCHPLQGVNPHLFYLSDLVSPLFFVNLPTKIFFLRVSPPGGCHPGRPPPSDATEEARLIHTDWRHALQMDLLTYLLTYR